VSVCSTLAGKHTGITGGERVDCPANYEPINWEAYIQALDTKIEKANFWMSPLMLPVAIGISLIWYILKENR
jgi:hypothetical protein